MGTTTSPDFFDKLFQNTAVGGFWHSTPVAVHVGLIVALAFVVHLLVKLVHAVSEWLVQKHSDQKLSFGFVAEKPKFVTLIHLIASAVTFVIYFLTVGVILIAVFHFNDTFFKTYLSSAAVLGLALSFGLQGLVQDVVTGVTLILSDAIEVGDIVDLSGVIGRVELIGLRFTKVVNFFNQEIFVPNRNIANVARFPQGGVYAYADIQFSTEADSEQVTALIREVADGVWTQFGAIIINKPEISEREVAAPGGGLFCGSSSRSGRDKP